VVAVAQERSVATSFQRKFARGRAARIVSICWGVLKVPLRLKGVTPH